MATLRDAYTAGRLTLEEFDERTSAAYASKTWGELRQLTEDLPSQPVLARTSPATGCPPPPCPPPNCPRIPSGTTGMYHRSGTGRARSRSSRS